jgi:hypothetical protein
MYCKTICIVSGLVASCSAFAGLEGETFRLTLESTDSPYLPGGSFIDLGDIVQGAGPEWSQVFPVWDYSDPAVPIVGQYEYILDVGDDYIEMTANWQLISPEYFSLLPGEFSGFHLDFENETNLSQAQQLQVTSNNSPVKHLGEYANLLNFPANLVQWASDHNLDPHALSRVSVGENTLDINFQGIGWHGVNPVSTETARIDLQFKCSGDNNGDGVVSIDDLLQLIGAWGPCAGCDEDITGDDTVDIDDLLGLLANWGACP